MRGCDRHGAGVWLVTVAIACDGSEGAPAGADAGGVDAGRSADAAADAACEAACNGRVCGDDGCGGSCGACAGDLVCDVGRCVDRSVALPEIHDYSGAPAARVEGLVAEALAGLGFAGDEAPRAQDRVFVGRHYLAWLDETGFFGKMNGLFWLNGAAGDDLDFSDRDTLGRPVNFFVPGEDGDGRWAPGYPGAEHVEFPSRIPEPNDDPDCAGRDWCNQYGLDEAASFSDPDIPWWSSCNAGQVGWLEEHEPVEIQEIDGGLRLIYQGRLVKEADGDGDWDGDDCHEDWLFADGVRRPVHLRVGYELRAADPYLDRLMQFENPRDNPPFDGPMSLIGGFVVTDWPDPHPLKALQRFVQPALRDVEDTVHGITLAAGQWTSLPSEPAGRDVVFAWLGQPFTLAAFDGLVIGHAVRMEHVGPSDNDDAGFCLCEVHGGLEIGGGLLHGGVSLPVPPGEVSIEARRRLWLGGAGWSPIARREYEAESDSMSHGPGRAEGEAWSASPDRDVAGHMLYGPYATDWGDGGIQVVFDVAADAAGDGDRDVVVLDVHDATAGEVIASRAVRGSELGGGSFVPVSVEASLAGRGGHRMEARVDFRDIAPVRVDEVTVFGAR